MLRLFGIGFLRLFGIGGSCINAAKVENGNNICLKICLDKIGPRSESKIQILCHTPTQKFSQFTHKNFSALRSGHRISTGKQIYCSTINILVI